MKLENSTPNPILTGMLSVLMTMFAVVPVQATNDDLSRILAAIPENANMVTFLDFDALNNSAWAKVHEIESNDLVGDAGNLQRIAIASNLDFQYFHADSQTIFITPFEKTGLEEFQRSDKSDRDSIAGTDIVWLADRSSVIAIGSNSFAINPSTNRQNVSKWIHNSLRHSGDDNDSVFFRFAGQQAANNESVLVVAMDFRDAISLNFAKQIVATNGVFEASNQAEAARLLSEIEGIVLTVDATESLSARIQVRFENDAAVLKNSGKMLVDSMLRGVGTRLKDIDSWTQTVEENVLTLSGPLSEDSFEDLTSLLILDTNLPANLRNMFTSLDVEAKSGQEDKESTSDQTSHVSDIPKSEKQVATKKYLQQVERLLKSLNQKTDDSLAESRFWIDRYALKLRYLNPENVDQKLLDFAGNTSTKMLAMAELLENAILEAAEEFESNWITTPTWRTVNYGGIRIRLRAYSYGGSNYGNDRNAVDRLQASNKLNDAVTKVKIEGIAIVREFNEVAAKLASEYGFEFERWTPADIR